MFGSAERVDFGRISDRVDDVMFVIFDLREDTLGKDVSSIPLTQLVAHNDQPFACGVLASRADLFSNRIGQRVVIKTFTLKVSSDFAFTGRISPSKPYQHFEGYDTMIPFHWEGPACLTTRGLLYWARANSAKL